MQCARNGVSSAGGSLSHVSRWVLLAGAATILLSSGCAVPQPRGAGQLKKLREPTTQREYFLYLPKAYVEATEQERARRGWPLVVTFHGLKPYDIAYYQAREWEYEADRYGYIVIAPVQMAPDSLFGQFPQRTLTSAFKADERAILAILDHVVATTHADASNVLSTGFSSGGYMAHYMLNRHPDRFTCLASRQANFSASLLDPSATQRSRYHPVLILSTQNDVAICKRESDEAIKWYERHDYKNFAWIHINKLGHERTPDLAADFFARVCSAEPMMPPDALVQRQAIDGNATGLALVAGKLGQLNRGPTQRSDRRRISSAESRRSGSPTSRTERRPVMRASQRDRQAAAQQPRRRAETPPRSNARPRAASTRSQLGIAVSSAVGFEPLLLVFSAECPAEWHRTADFLWTLDGKPVAHTVNGQKTISTPGDYRLELLVVTQDGTEHRAGRQIRVLSDAETSAASRG